ncbi:hypothetical protein C8N35_11626 [Breoghania corrubedonensis]|uniref:Uncharacterized protein n=1 Tax=Breoghania corrubedonensis TaxID=665038 RepID=A0A2T5UQ79_9HYPH|nr:hypothetical protein [Breoghania corrubedonensis]PTW53571.1 hypothetical protein C8N35_11626 [Breoghania corrubedonensis]
MMLGAISKKPLDRLDYRFDFSRWMPSGDHITGAEATIAGSTASVFKTDWSEREVQVWLEGGAAGERGTVTLIITTEAQRVKEVAAGLEITENCR